MFRTSTSFRSAASAVTAALALGFSSAALADDAESSLQVLLLVVCSR